MNAIGGTLGLVAAVLLLRLCDQPVSPVQEDARPTGLVAAAAVTVMGVAWALAITPTFVDATSLQIAGNDERAAAQRAVHQAFGNRYKIINVQLSPGFQGAADTVLIALDHGFVELSWPDATQLSAGLESSSTDQRRAFPVPGATSRPKTKEDALAIARRYAAGHYPWGLHASAVTVQPVGPGGELGWLVSWRRVRDHILLPMRLDVQIGTAGGVTQLFARQVDDPPNLPKSTVDKATAVRIAVQNVQETGPQFADRPATADVLLAVKRSAGRRVQ